MNTGQHHQTALFRPCLFLCLWLVRLASPAAVLTVTNFADSGPGTLRDIIANAASGDTINFDPALSGQTNVLTSGQLVLSSNLTIDAFPLSQRPVISGNNQHRVLTVAPNVSAVLRNLTITTGKSPDYAPLGGPSPDGGAILNQGSLELHSSRILSSAAGAGGRGGGIFNLGQLLVSNSLIAANRAGNPFSFPGTGISGGGIANVGTATILDSTIENNRGASGNNGGGDAGGILNSGNLTVSRCAFLNNTAGGAGGTGFYGGDGGAIYNTGALTIENTSMTGNQGGFGWAGGNGGAIHNLGTCTLAHVTIVSNSSGFAFVNPSGYGGGLYQGSAGTNCLIFNSIIAENTATAGENVFGAFTGSNNLTVGNARLAPLDLWGGKTATRPPLPGSPAIDTGAMLTNLPATDQRGVARLSGAAPDIGAVEAFAFSTLTLVDTDGDGIDDRLEPAYGLVVGVNDSAMDSDSDGSFDWQELHNMTDPKNADSVLRIRSITYLGTNDPVSGMPVFAIALPTFPGLGYELQANPALTNFQTVSNSQFTATNSIQTMEVLLAPERDFLRVKRTAP
jgi:hypothetical protein